MHPSFALGGFRPSTDAAAIAHACVGMGTPGMAGAVGALRLGNGTCLIAPNQQQHFKGQNASTSLTSAQKKKAKREANRKSAQKCRQRKKEAIQAIQDENMRLREQQEILHALTDMVFSFVVTFDSAGASHHPPRSSFAGNDGNGSVGQILRNPGWATAAGASLDVAGIEVVVTTCHAGRTGDIESTSKRNDVIHHRKDVASKCSSFAAPRTMQPSSAALIMGSLSRGSLEHQFSRAHDNAQYALVFVSQAVHSTLQYKDNELLGHSFFDILSFDSREQLDRIINTKLEMYASIIQHCRDKHLLRQQEQNNHKSPNMNMGRPRKKPQILKSVPSSLKGRSPKAPDDGVTTSQQRFPDAKHSFPVPSPQPQPSSSRATALLPPLPMVKLVNRTPFAENIAVGEASSHTMDTSVKYTPAMLVGSDASNASITSSSDTTRPQASSAKKSCTSADVAVPNEKSYTKLPCPASTRSNGAPWYRENLPLTCGRFDCTMDKKIISNGGRNFSSPPVCSDPPRNMCRRRRDTNLGEAKQGLRRNVGNSIAGGGIDCDGVGALQFKRDFPRSLPARMGDMERPSENTSDEIAPTVVDLCTQQRVQMMKKDGTVVTANVNGVLSISIDDGVQVVCSVRPVHNQQGEELDCKSENDPDQPLRACELSIMEGATKRPKSDGNIGVEAMQAWGGKRKKMKQQDRKVVSNTNESFGINWIGAHSAQDRGTGGLEQLDTRSSVKLMVRAGSNSSREVSVASDGDAHEGDVDVSRALFLFTVQPNPAGQCSFYLFQCRLRYRFLGSQSAGSYQDNDIFDVDADTSSDSGSDGEARGPKQQ